jgi:hypothetical protein
MAPGRRARSLWRAETSPRRARGSLDDERRGPHEEKQLPRARIPFPRRGQRFARAPSLVPERGDPLAPWGEGVLSPTRAFPWRVPHRTHQATPVTRRPKGSGTPPKPFPRDGDLAPRATIDSGLAANRFPDAGMARPVRPESFVLEQDRPTPAERSLSLATEQRSLAKERASASQEGLFLREASGFPR